MRLQNFALAVVFLMIHFRKVFFSFSDIIIVLLGLLQAETYGYMFELGWAILQNVTFWF